MAIEKINFSYPKGTLQSVFDNEALTALELASKTSKKVDECVEVVNAVEQTAIEATAIVDDMYVIQNQFVTDNSDTRAQLINDNQEYLDTLEASKEQFETDINASKEQFETDLNASKEQFETDMSNEINTIVENSENLINSEVTTKIETMANDGSLADVIDQQIFTEIHQNIEDISVNVKNFGAKGDGITDDTQAIKNAILSAKLVNGSILYVPAGNYIVKDTITIPPNINIKMIGTILFDSSLYIPAVVVGQSDSQIVNKEIALRVKKLVISDWQNENSIGIKIINAYTCKINIIHVEGFTVGIQFIGHLSGFSYNEVYLNLIYNNKIGVDLTSFAGWVNENNYYGGRITHSSANANLDRVGVRISSQDYIPERNANNNVFYKPCFEMKGHADPSITATPILIEHGRFNTFNTIRNENNSEITAKILNKSSNNNISVGYGIIKVEDLSESPSTVSTSMYDYIIKDVTSLIYSSGNLYKNACYYNGSTSVHIPNVTTGSSSSASTSPKDTGINIMSDYLELTGDRCIGVYVGTLSCKTFVVKRDVVSIANAGQLLIRCYDALGNVLSNDIKRVKSTNNTSSTYQTTYGGCYTFGQTSQDLYFTVDENTAYMFVGFKRAGAPVQIRSFSIYAKEKNVSYWTGYEEIIKGANLGTTPPTVGSWNKGRIILNDDKEELGEIGSKYIIDSWECIEEGTPGTWIEKRYLTGN